MSQIRNEAFPVERFAPAAPIEPLKCHTLYQQVKALYRPHVAADTLTFNARSDTNFQAMNPLTSCNVDNFGPGYLHFRYGRQSAFPLALHNLLPHYAQSSVPA